MTVMMVRGLFTNLEFPYVQFPCNKVTGDLLFQPLWEVLGRIELLGFKVIAVTADGASTNHRFFQLHNLSARVTPHMTINPYACEECYIYFFSDVPHLLKTVRNGLASNTRYLWILYLYVTYICIYFSSVKESHSSGSTLWISTRGTQEQ